MVFHPSLRWWLSRLQPDRDVPALRFHRVTRDTQAPQPWNLCPLIFVLQSKLLLEDGKMAQWVLVPSLTSWMVPTW